MPANRAESISRDQRYFGKDLTNIEAPHQVSVEPTQHPAGREGVQSRSGLKSTAREGRRAGIAKPSPMQFYKGIFENQRSMHRRANQGESNKSESIEQAKNQSKSRFKVDQSIAQIRNDVVKQQISKLLRSKGRLGSQLSNGEGSKDKTQLQPRIKDTQANSRERPYFEQAKIFSSRPAQEGIQSSANQKYSSLVNIGQNSNINGRIGSRRTPSNNANKLLKPQQGSGSDTRNVKVRVPSLANKFKNLRLHLDDKDNINPALGSKDLCEELDNQDQVDLGVSVMVQENIKQSSRDNCEMMNELDELPAAKPFGNESDTNSRGGIDIPFIWEYLLTQEVA